jgi:hypothetical protein
LLSQQSKSDPKLQSIDRSIDCLLRFQRLAQLKLYSLRMDSSLLLVGCRSVSISDSNMLYSMRLGALAQVRRLNCSSLLAIIDADKLHQSITSHLRNDAVNQSAFMNLRHFSNQNPELLRATIAELQSNLHQNYRNKSPQERARISAAIERLTNQLDKMPQTSTTHKSTSSQSFNKPQPQASQQQQQRQQQQQQQQQQQPSSNSMPEPSQTSKPTKPQLNSFSAALSNSLSRANRSANFAIPTRPAQNDELSADNPFAQSLSAVQQQQRQQQEAKLQQDYQSQGNQPSATTTLSTTTSHPSS